MYMCKRYYLDTNAIYSLVNKLERIATYSNVCISMLGIQEIISAIYDKSNFDRSKAAISKIKSSGISIYPYLPIECIAMAFKLDFTELELIMNRKKELWKRATMLSESMSYLEYEEKLNKIGIDINSILQDEKETEVFNLTKFRDTVCNDSIKMKQTKINQKKNPQCYEISIDDLIIDESVESQKKRREEAIRPTLVNFLDNCMLVYNEDDVKAFCENYNGELTAFLLGCLLYNFKKAYKDGGKAGRNDFIDLQHLLYLRNEKDIIVSEDRIFKTSTVFKQRITINEFREIFQIS